MSYTFASSDYIADEFEEEFRSNSILRWNLEPYGWK